MRVALVHDYLNQYGGAERTLEHFLDLFPHADLYTLVSGGEGAHRKFAHRITGTSMLNSELVARWHRPFIPLMPLAAATIDLGNRYDLVVSATAGYAKGVRHGPRAFHLSYCYTPLRYAWESDYIPEKLNARRSVLGMAASAVVAPAAAYLRWWDYRAAQRPDVMLAISNFIAGKIKACYGRQASVVYPAIDHRRFFADDPATCECRADGRGQRYLAVGRLLHYKRFDLLIDAFAKMPDRKLIIVGDGPEYENLRYRAVDFRNISFRHFVSDRALRRLYCGSRALVFPQVEDFGLVAAESLACGTPVIALAAGGAAEIVEDGITGVHIRAQSPEAIIAAVNRFESLSFDRARISGSTARFSADRFKREILSHIPPRVLEA